MYAIVCRCFCVMPVKFYSAPSTKEAPPSDKIAPSKFLKLRKYFQIKSYWNLLQICLSLFAISAITVATHYQYTEFDSNLGFLTRVLYMGEYTTGIVNMLLITLGGHYQNRYYLEYAMDLIEVDFKLLKCGTKIDYKFVKIYLQFYMIVYGVFFAIVLFVDFNYNEGNIVGFFRSSSIFTVPNIICLLGLTQYSGFLYCVRIRFIQLNKILRKIGRDSMRQSVNYFKEKTKTTDIISVVEFAKIKDPNKLSPKEMFNELRYAHSDLCILIKKLNESFGILVISAMITTFVSLSIQFYAIYKAVEGFSNNFYLTIYTLLWIIMMGGKTVIILFASSGVDDNVII